MISEAFINLGIVAATCLILLIYLIRFVLRYKHQYESNPLCTSAVIFCLVVVLVSTFILPADIFFASFVKNSDGTIKEWATPEVLARIDKAFFVLYYGSYVLITILVFIVIPFLHFFNEDSESNLRDRFHMALRCTFYFVVLMVLLLLLGGYMDDGTATINPIFDKIIHITGMNKFQKAMTMIMTILTMAGFMNVTFYTASGIFSWPIGLIMGNSSIAVRVSAMEDRETVLRIKVNELEERNRFSGLNPQDREELLSARETLRELELEGAALHNYRETLSYKLRKVIRPAQKLSGVLFGVLSLVLLFSLGIVNVDRFMNGAGPSQGYVIVKPTLFNPLEYVYMKLQDLLIIGPMPLLLVTCFLVVATISGMRNLGLWFLFTRIYRIKIGRTQPQALLFFCISLMLATLSYGLLLYSMTTDYITFGDQRYSVNGNSSGNSSIITKPCSLQDYHPDCILTRGSVLIMRMLSQVWIFGAIFYWWSWVFVVISGLSLVAYLIRGKRSASHDIVAPEEEFEE